MGIAVWIASMIGYDKVLQLIQQLSNITPKEKKGDDEDAAGSDDDVR